MHFRTESGNLFQQQIVVSSTTMTVLWPNAALKAHGLTLRVRDFGVSAVRLLRCEFSYENSFILLCAKSARPNAAR